jgi:hypothetical protein
LIEFVEKGFFMEERIKSYVIFKEVPFFCEYRIELPVLNKGELIDFELKLVDPSKSFRGKGPDTYKIEGTFQIKSRKFKYSAEEGLSQYLSMERVNEKIE